MNIIFDMDGTLIDSAKIAIPAFAGVCPEFGLKVPDDEALISVVGYANPIFYFKLYPDEDKAKLLKFGEKIEAAELEITGTIGEGLLFDGVYKMLEILNKKGCRLYIASTGDKDHVYSCLKACGVFSLFEGIFCGKPDKEIMVAEIIKNDRDGNWIMVGDRRKDSVAAKYNNIFSVGAAFGYCAKEDFDEFDAVIYDPMDLIPLIFG